MLNIFFYIITKQALFGTVRPWRIYQCACLDSATHQKNSSTLGRCTKEWTCDFGERWKLLRCFVTTSANHETHCTVLRDMLWTNTYDSYMFYDSSFLLSYHYISFFFCFLFSVFSFLRLLASRFSLLALSQENNHRIHSLLFLVVEDNNKVVKDDRLKKEKILIWRWK